MVRAAIDIGSGGPKLRIAEIDLITNKMTKILYTEQYPVIFQNCLSNGGDKLLTPEVMFQGIQALKNAIESANSFGAKGVVLVGTSVFRNAANSELFVHSIQSETGYEVHILDPELEGKLAFQAAQAQLDVDVENLVVWDVGGGSTQFITVNEDGSYLVDASNEGSGSFRDFIIESIQQRNMHTCKSPNPISIEEAYLAYAYASTLATEIDPAFQDKLHQLTTQVVGVGSVFARNIAPLFNGKRSFTIEDLTLALDDLIGKSDSELGNSDYVSVEVSNPLLVLSFMKALDIKQMSIINVNNADGAMIYQEFWK